MKQVVFRVKSGTKHPTLASISRRKAVHCAERVVSLTTKQLEEYRSRGTGQGLATPQDL